MASGIKHLLECNVCSNSFNDKDRVPKGLPCQHTFCLACLKRIKTHGFHTGDDGSVSIRVLVKCPECGQRFLAPGENINNFPNNLTMISLLGALKQTVALRPTPDADLRSCLGDRVQRLRDEISESAEMLVGNLSGLEKQVTVAQTNIKNTFDRLRDEIDRREEYLLDELDDFIARKETIVKHPTEGMARQLQEMEKFCNEMDRRAKVKRDSCLPTYIDHCLELIEKLEQEKRHPKWEASFQPSNTDAIRATLSQFGKLNLFAPESDESEGDDDDRRISSVSSLASRCRQRDSSPYSMSPTPSENAIEYNAEENDRNSPWSRTSGSYTDDTADEAVTGSPKYRPEKSDVRTRNRETSSPQNRRRRITAIQSSLEFEQKYGGVPQLVEPPNSRLLAIGAPTSSSVYSRSRDRSRSNSHSRSREYQFVQTSDVNETNARSSQQTYRSSEISRASGISTFSHDSFDYEVPDFDTIPPPVGYGARRNTVERLKTVTKSPVANLTTQLDDKDEIYSQPFDSEDHLTDDNDPEDDEYVGAGLAWPPIPRNNDTGNLPDGFELLEKPYLGRQDTLTSMDSYVDMDLQHQNIQLSYTKSDCESTDIDPLEALENLDITHDPEENQITSTDSSSTYSQSPYSDQADNFEKSHQNSLKAQGSQLNRQRNLSNNSNDITENPYNDQAANVEKSHQNSLKAQGSQLNRQRNLSNNSNDITENPYNEQAANVEKSRQNSLKEQGNKKNRQRNLSNNSNDITENPYNEQAANVEKSHQNSLEAQGSQLNRQRNLSNNSNDITDAEERIAPIDPAARRKAFVESHNSDFLDMSSSKSLYEDVTVSPKSPSSLPVESITYSDAPLLNNAVRKFSNGPEMIISESESEQSRPNSRVVSRTVSIELPDISSLSFNVGILNGDGDIPTEIPPIMDAPGVGLGSPIFGNMPIFVVNNPQDLAFKMRPSSWSPKQNSPTHHLTVNGALYAEVRRSSWSPLSIKEFEEYEHGLSVSEWSSDESTSEEDPYEIMSWSMPCGLDRIDKLDINNKLDKLTEHVGDINKLSANFVDRTKLSANFKRKSHPVYSETCTSADDIQAQPRPRSYALCRQDRINNEKGESQIYWFPPRRLSRKRNSRRVAYKLAEASGESMAGSMDGPSEPTRSSSSRSPPRVAKKPLVGHKSST